MSIEKKKDRIIVFDNGGDTIKCGLSGSRTCQRVANYGIRPKREKRIYYGTDVHNVLDKTACMVARPTERGYVTDWDFEERIWRNVINNGLKIQDPAGHHFFTSHPMFTPETLLREMDEIVFEKFGFEAYMRATPAKFSVIGVNDQLRRKAESARTKKTGGEEKAEDILRTKHLPAGAIVVDAGFSSTHVTPVLSGSEVNFATQRINVGGKLMTNYLREMISYRQLNMNEETHIVKHIKECMCFVSRDFHQELKMSIASRKSPLLSNYVLPNGSTRLIGHLKGAPNTSFDPDLDQTVTLNNERIHVPELLFHPSYVGVNQIGLADTIALSLERLPSLVRPFLTSSVVVVGGSAQFPGLAQRLTKDLRSRVCWDYDVCVQVPPSPSIATWQGMSLWAGKTDEFYKSCVTKKEYEEYGRYAVCKQKFRFL